MNPQHCLELPELSLVLLGRNGSRLLKAPAGRVTLKCGRDGAFMCFCTSVLVVVTQEVFGQLLPLSVLCPGRF